MTESIAVLIIEKDDSTKKILRMYLEELEYLKIEDTSNTLESSYAHILKTVPDIIIVDVSNDYEKNYEIIEKFSKKIPHTKIIATAVNYNTETIIKAMRCGVREFLPKPIIKDNLLLAIDKFKNQLDGSSTTENNSKVITAFSNKGGVGITSVAVNLALELANITKEKVALVDLNLHLGDITTFLDIKPSFDISYLIKKLNIADEEFLLSTLEQYQETGLYILADPPYMEQSNKITPEDITKLLNVLRETFSYIIVDTGSSFDNKTITVLDNSDLILLISAINIPSIRNCQRCIDAFERLGYEDEKTKIIINRFMENDTIKQEDVEKALDKEIYWKIPNNYFTIMSAINTGLPVSAVNSDSNIAKSYRELATNISDNIYKQNIIKKINRNPLVILENLI